MKELTSEDYCQYYANKCKICSGKRRIKYQGTWTACVCQQAAILKFRFERFPVEQPDLKYKTWDDFCGWTDVDGKILTDQSLVDAKSKALQYCFGSSDPAAFKNRRKYLKVQEHLYDGQNVIIIGDHNTGKTLLAVLIIKEVAHACRIHNRNIGYQYITSWSLKDAARWDNNKSINHDLLNELSEIEFLVIDKLELMPEIGHHTNPPDYNSMNQLFWSRRRLNHPTINICSSLFWSRISDRRYHESMSSQWSREFILLLNDPKNLIIRLSKEVNVG